MLAAVVLLLASTGTATTGGDPAFRGGWAADAAWIATGLALALVVVLRRTRRHRSRSGKAETEPDTGASDPPGTGEPTDRRAEPDGYASAWSRPIDRTTRDSSPPDIHLGPDDRT